MLVKHRNNLPTLVELMYLWPYETTSISVPGSELVTSDSRLNPWPFWWALNTCFFRSELQSIHLMQVFKCHSDDYRLQYTFARTEPRTDWQTSLLPSWHVFKVWAFGLSPTCQPCRNFNYVYQFMMLKIKAIFTQYRSRVRKQKKKKDF